MIPILFVLGLMGILLLILMRFMYPRPPVLRSRSGDPRSMLILCSHCRQPHDPATSHYKLGRHFCSLEHLEAYFKDG